jgi:preprotein translocase subunit YajC
MGTGIYGILSWVLILAVFYIFLILPERKRQKSMRNMINSISVGDKILTRGGIYGRIISTTEDSIIIESGPDNVKLEMAKAAIGNVIERTNEAAEESTQAIEEPTESEEKSE